MIKIAICDDRVKELGVMEELLNKIYCVKYQYDIFSSPYELLHYLSEKKERYGLFLIALEVKEIGGIKLAEEIRKFQKNSLIVFQLETKGSIYRCLDSYIFQYLIEPISLDNLIGILKKADDYLEASRQILSFVLKRTIYTIPCEEILYIEMSQRKGWIKTSWRMIESNLTMEEILSKIDLNCFVQTHRSFIVNLKYVVSVQKKEVEIVNGEKIYLSRSFAPTMKERYITYYGMS